MPHEHDVVRPLGHGDAVDVLAARAAGMASIAVTWGAGDRADLLAAGPLAVVDTMDEMRGQLLLG